MWWCSYISHATVQWNAIYAQIPSVSFITFWVLLLADRQTNQRYRKHNLLCQGGTSKKKKKKF